GLRPGNNLFAESIVAIDYKTGVRKWHFQLVHHPIWNMDIAAAPILVDLTVGGRPVKAVAVMGKQAMLYLFDRVTGTPVFPIYERPVQQSAVFRFFRLRSGRCRSRMCPEKKRRRRSRFRPSRPLTIIRV